LAEPAHLVKLTVRSSPEQLTGHHLVAPQPALLIAANGLCSVDYRFNHGRLPLI